MSSIRSSRLTIAVVLLAVLLGAAGTAAALSISASNVPDEAEVGTEVNATITIDDAYTENSQWTLEAETELENVSWTVEEYDQGSRVNQWTGGGGTFTQQLSSDPSGDQIRIEVRGEVPEIDEYSFDPEENFTFAAIRRSTGNNTETLETYTVHHYTNKSRNAREKIEEAQEALDSASGSNNQATRSLKQAISAYNNGNFNNAISNAQDAKQSAKQAEQSQQTTQMLLFGGGAVVVILAIVGGFYYYRQQQDDYDKLR